MRYISILFLLSCFLLSTPLRAERVKVIVRQPIVPVLTKKEINPVLQLKLIKSCPGPCFVKEIGLSLKGTTLLTDLTHLSLYRVAGKRGLSDWEKCVDSVAPALKTVLDTPLELKSDTTILWVTVKLKDKVDLTHRVTVSCDHVTTTCGKGFCNFRSSDCRTPYRSRCTAKRGRRSSYFAYSRHYYFPERNFDGHI